MGANLSNQMIRSGGTSLKYIARQLTLGRLLIVGEKGLSAPKCIASKKAAYQATKKHAADTEIKHGKNSIRDTDTRLQLVKSKIDPYEEFAQQLFNPPRGGIFGTSPAQHYYEWQKEHGVQNRGPGAHFHSTAFRKDDKNRVKTARPKNYIRRRFSREIAPPATVATVWTTKELVKKEGKMIKGQTGIKGKTAQPLHRTIRMNGVAKKAK